MYSNLIKFTLIAGINFKLILVILNIFKSFYIFNSDFLILLFLIHGKSSS